jgi:ComF family protein
LIEHLRMRGAFSGVLAKLSAALLPQDCHLCGLPLAAVEPPDPRSSGPRFSPHSTPQYSLLCRPCGETLPRIASPCPRCAMPTPAGQVCGQCLRHPPHYDATLTALDYRFPVDRLVQELKYAARLPLAALFAELFAAQLSLDREDAPDLLLPLPLHPARLRARGFNQAAEIARALAPRCGLEQAAPGVRRVLDTPPQTALPIAKRRANIRGAFECDLDLTGRRVAVVDDVMTTGSTLNELARVLKKNGAARVENWVIARTVRLPGEV